MSLTSKDFPFTSESVSRGHPDKVADQIADAILDEFLTYDIDARVACEVAISNKNVLVFGEVSSTATVDIEEVTRKTIRDIGYLDQNGQKFNHSSVGVNLELTTQSPDIAQGVNKKNQGAGDQGTVFGYACKDTEVFLPAPIYYAHQLVRKLDELRSTKDFQWLGPDAKSQVTINYRDFQPISVSNIVISAQHTENMTQKSIREHIIEACIIPTFSENLLQPDTIIHINPSGRFVIGGPTADSGLTGRKIIVDSYGGFGRHGGGSFSGKDPSKIDRSAAYLARHIALNVVADGYADRCEIHLTYAIGISKPQSFHIETFGSNHIPNEEIKQIALEKYPMEPADMIKYLKLRRPGYKDTAAYGHFGRAESFFTWEKTMRQLQQDY